MDAHCFHMGTPLIGGDIEDLDGVACVVCPAHRYRIDIATGKKVDTDLCGKQCSSVDQKQRLYPVYCDNEYIFADIPQPGAQPAAPLPSDYYNQVCHDYEHRDQLHRKGSGPQNYGLFGPAPQAPNSPPPPLQPYAGVKGWIGVPEAAHSTAEEPQLVLSQQAPPSPPSFRPDPEAQSRINFPAAKADSPFVARRKAATAAILARSYRPPTDSAMQSPEKGAVEPPPRTKVVQKTLFQAWGPQAVAAGPENMDMN